MPPDALYEPFFARYHCFAIILKIDKVAISREEGLIQSIGRHPTIIKSKVANAMRHQIINPISASVSPGNNSLTVIPVRLPFNGKFRLSYAS